MRYRTHVDLNLGGGKIIPRGVISPLREIRPAVIEVLLKQEAITAVGAPPISALGSAWAARALKLARADIVDIDGLLDAEPKALAKKLRGVSAQDVIDWQHEAESLLKI